MTDKRREHVWDLFDRAGELPPGDRVAFLDAACEGDAALRAEVESLLAYDNLVPEAKGDSQFLVSPLVRVADDRPTRVRPDRSASPSQVPKNVGRYRIIRLLGEGGMGCVYEAEQENPRRTVALKMIRAGLVSPGLVARFAREAQVLGRLHHPGIAQIYDAGVAENTKPYFAMEFIQGLRIDEYSRRHSLDAPGRLNLMAKVCDALHHAHDKGVIHRDLKPANVLVDESGQPKILDFGVARVNAIDLASSAGRTETGQLIGTLGYMSPEQVSASPTELDSRSDVYALGVILFELLASRLPYNLDQLPLPEIARVILEQEPSRLGSLNSQWRGDIETIVAKALEKDKARRYASAALMAADIRRYLNHEPIHARPASALYQLRKFVRRNKALVGGVSGVIAALVLGLALSLFYAFGEAEQRRKAVANAGVADAERHLALRQAYRGRIAAAMAALQGHDVAEAARQLDAAPQALREWEWYHLASRLDESATVIAPHAGEKLSLVACLEGLRFLSFTATGLRVSDENGGESLALSMNCSGDIQRIQQTHGETRFVIRAEKVTRILDGSGRECFRLPDAIQWAFSPDQTRVAISPMGALHPSSTFETYDTATGKRLISFAGHTDQVYALAFSPDGRQIASASEDGTARLWGTETGRPITVFRGHKVKVLNVAFRPDGARLVTASADGTVRQWDPKTGMEVEPPYERHASEVAVAVYSPDGQWIASGGADRTVRIWHAAGNHDSTIWHGHTELISQLAFSPDGRRLASSSADGTIRIWTADTRSRLPVLRGHNNNYVYPVAFSPNGQWIASGGWDSTVRLWDARTGEMCGILRHPSRVLDLTFSPDGTHLVSGCGDDDQLRVWEIATGRLEREIKGPGINIHTVAFGRDASQVAAVAISGRATIVNVATGSEVESFDPAKFSKLAYSPNGQWLAMGADHGIVAVRDAATLSRQFELVGHTKAVSSIAFSADGSRIATASYDRTVRVWDLASGKCLAIMTGHTDDIFAVAFHPDGNRIASAGRDGTIWIWNAATGDEMARLQGHTNYVWSLTFSADGSTLISGSGDGTVRLWDTFPLARRYRAQRDSEALRPEAERKVETLFREKTDAAAVVAALRAETTMSEPLRTEALHAVLRRQTMSFK